MLFRHLAVLLELRRRKERASRNALALGLDTAGCNTCRMTLYKAPATTPQHGVCC